MAVGLELVYMRVDSEGCARWLDFHHCTQPRLRLVAMLRGDPASNNSIDDVEGNIEAFRHSILRVGCTFGSVDSQCTDACGIHP